MDLTGLRASYKKGELLESEVSSDPFEQFAVWFEQALSSGTLEPNAMALATAGADGAPNCRTVLLKSFDARGFVFYTNTESRKAREMAANPRAALCFYWADLERQVRIAGSVHPVSREEAEAYFASRPIGHQLGAWASRQSAVIPGREVLEQNLAEARLRFGTQPAHLPPWWGGYRIRPVSMEFWQGRPDRLHDRIEYLLQPDGTWIFHRLAP